MNQCFVKDCNEFGKIILYAMFNSLNGINFCDKHADSAMKLVTKNKINYLTNLVELEINLRNIK